MGQEGSEEDRFWIKGRVLDENGDPLHEVEVVSVENRDIYEKTDSFGAFNITIREGSQKLEFKKEGYQRLDLLIDGNKNQTIPEDKLIMKEKDENDENRKVNLRKVCLFCCGIPLCVILFFVVIGLLVRLRKVLHGKGSKKRSERKGAKKRRKKISKVKE